MNIDLYIDCLTDNQVEEIKTEAIELIQNGADINELFMVRFYPDNNPDSSDHIMGLFKVNSKLNSSFTLKELSSINLLEHKRENKIISDTLNYKRIAVPYFKACKAYLDKSLPVLTIKRNLEEDLKQLDKHVKKHNYTRF